MAFTSKCHEFVQEQNLGTLGKMLIKIVKKTEVPRAVWTWTHRCVWETGTAAASGRVGLDVFARHGLAGGASDYLLVPTVQRE